MAKKPAKAATTIAPGANETPGMLLDEIARARKAQKDMKKQEGIEAEKLKALIKLPDGDLLRLSEAQIEAAQAKIQGEEYSGNFVLVIQERFDTESFKAEHPKMYQEYLKQLAFFQLKIDR